MKKLASLVSLVLFLSFVLSACRPGQMFGPTLTPISTITPTFTLTPMLTPIPTLTPAPTITSTPAPENLADANDLHVWIDDYVHAYGGRVTVNGIEMDANQLLAAVKTNPGSYIERKTIKGSAVLFFVVHGAPLAVQNNGTWRSILARDLSDAIGAQFVMPVLFFQIYNPNFVKAVSNANMIYIINDLNTSQVFNKWTTADWKQLLRDWDTIKAQLDAGKIPNSLYNWSQADQTIHFAQENHMGLKGASLVWNGDVPDSIYNGGFTKDELLKILEFTISVKVMKYKGVISEWDATSELIISEFSTDKWGFWQQHVGLMDVTRLSTSLIRKIDPEAKIIIADDHELEEGFCSDMNGSFICQQPDLNIRFMRYVNTLKQEGLIDTVLIENNLWIYDMPSQEYMENFLRQIQAEGIGVAAPQINVFSTDPYPLWGFPRPKNTTVDDRIKAQAEDYARVVQAYINVGANDIGLGDVGDETSGVNYYNPGTSPALFDMQWRPRMGWYEILKVMYDGFLK